MQIQEYWQIVLIVINLIKRNNLNFPILLGKIGKKFKGILSKKK
jgi:hypothetical protein